jgi:hypothetical protein
MKRASARREAPHHLRGDAVIDALGDPAGGALGGAAARIDRERHQHAPVRRGLLLEVAAVAALEAAQIAAADRREDDVGGKGRRRG